MPAKPDKIVEINGAGVDHLALLKRADDLRTHVRAATNCRRVAEHFRRLFDRLNDSFVSRSFLVRDLDTVARECARANECARPRAKVFRTETAAHDFLDVVVNVTP